MAEEILIPDPPEGGASSTPATGKKIGSETVIVSRKPRVDRLKPASGAEEQFDVPGCVLLPRAANEAGRGWVQRDGFTLVAPHGSDITADDDVIARGYRYSVEGVPGDFRNKRGRGKALMVTLSGVR